MLHIMTRQFSIVREPDMGHRWRLASCRPCFRSGAGAWEGLARALVFLGQMFQRGGGVQPAARPSFKCLFSVLLTSGFLELHDSNGPHRSSSRLPEIAEVIRDPVSGSFSPIR